MSLTKTIRYKLLNTLNLKALDEKLTAQKLTQKTSGAIVTFTSVPKRIPFIKPTLISLLKQIEPPERIEINLSRSLFPDQNIPDFLKNLNMIKICWQDTDYGPATKLIGTLKRYHGNNTPIIVVDDDMYYSSRLIEDLMAAYRARTSNEVFCINGFLIPKDLKSESIGSDKALKAGIRKVGVIEGCGGYILNSNLLTPNILLDLNNTSHRVLFDDDIWFSGHLSRLKVNKYQISTGRRKSLINTIETAISGDRQALQTGVMNYFANDWKPDEYQNTLIN